MSIAIRQRYTRANDQTQQEQNVNVSVDRTRVDKEGQEVDVAILKATAGGLTYFKEITELVQDLLDGAPNKSSNLYPYAFLEDLFDVSDPSISLSATALEKLNLEAGDFILIMTDFSVDHRTDLLSANTFRRFVCHEIAGSGPFTVSLQRIVNGAVPTFADNNLAFLKGSIIVNLSKVKVDSNLGDEGQLGLKAQLEQPTTPTASAVGGAGQVDVTITESTDLAVVAYQVYIRSTRPTAITPDMVPDALGLPTAFSGGEAVVNVTQYGGGAIAGGGDTIGAGTYYAVVTALTDVASYSGVPSDPSTPVAVTVT